MTFNLVYKVIFQRFTIPRLSILFACNDFAIVCGNNSGGKLYEALHMKSRTTLKKISANLNLSISTVSRALKNHPDISEDTKKKVKDLAALLEYEPNTYAINLRTNSSRVIGLIVPAVSNLFYDFFISAAEHEAWDYGYSLMILQSGDSPALEAENLKMCKANRVAGVLISITPNSELENFRKLEEAGIPLIFFDKVPEGDHFNKVCHADEEAARIAALTIINYKKKNVLAVFGNPALSITRKRLDAFREVFQKESPDTRLHIRHCNSLEEAEKSTSQFLNSGSPFDQLFAMSDETLAGSMKSLYSANVRIPSDVSVLAISNGFLPTLLNPPITFIETSGFELGKLAIKRMMDYLDGQTFTRSITLPCRFMEGKSMALS